MEILLITPSAYTLGGIASWIDYLLPGLERFGWRGTLGLVSGPRHHIPTRYLEAHPYHRSVSIHCNSGTRLGRVRAIRRTLRKLKPDIVLTANIPEAVIATAMERGNGNRRSRVVMSCHGIQRDLFEDMYRLRTELDHVVCTNKLACVLAEDIGEIAPARIHHARCGTVVPDQMPECSINRQFTIAFAGRLEQEQKRVLDLVEIGVALKSRGVNFKVNIAGAGPDEQILRSELKIQGLTEYFHFLGAIEPAAMSELVYQNSDALLLTSSWETGPIVAWEAMAAGVPIVTSRYLGIESESILFDRSNCLTFEVGDCVGAARQLEKLASDRNVGESIRLSAFSTVTTTLTKDISIEQWAQVLALAMEMEPVSSSARCPPENVQPAGRLDRWLGPSLAESVRSFRGATSDTGPAGEWPHTLGGRLISDDEFWHEAKRLDRAAGNMARS